MRNPRFFTGHHRRRHQHQPGAHADAHGVTFHPFSTLLPHPSSSSPPHHPLLHHHHITTPSSSSPPHHHPLLHNHCTTGLCQRRARGQQLRLGLGRKAARMRHLLLCSAVLMLATRAQVTTIAQAATVIGHNTTTRTGKRCGCKGLGVVKLLQ